MPNPNGAGDIPTSTDLLGVLQIKKGSIQDNPRGGPKHDILVKLEDGYEVLRAKIARIVRPLGLPDDFLIYFRRTRNAVQARYEPITADNFEEWLRIRWAKITTQEVVRWEEEGKEPREVQVIEFFVFKPRSLQRGNAGRIRRATANSIAEAQRRIGEHDNNQQLGEIQRFHLAHINARRPEGAPLIFPEDATNNQAARLDQARAQLDNEDAQAAAERNNLVRPIRIRWFNGDFVEIPVDVTSL